MDHLTVNHIRGAGYTLAQVARLANVRYDRLHRALGGGYGWAFLDASEQAATIAVLVRLGIVKAGAPVT